MRHATPMSLEDIRRNYSKNYKFLTKVRKEPKHILLIEDDEDMSVLIKQSLVREFPKTLVSIASDPYEAMNFMLDHKVDYIIADWNLPNMKAKGMVSIAEKTFGMDPTLDPAWEEDRIGVITLSASGPEECKIPSSAHFNYLGHVYKKQSINKILQSLKQFMQKKLLAA